MASRSKPRRLIPGMLVEVLSWPEVEQTLDGSGTLKGLPFMPEMRAYCGMRFTVQRRIERTCEESEDTMRRMRNAVFLAGLRCSGSYHGDCHRGCMIFWNEAWLRPVSGAASDKTPSPMESRAWPYLSRLPDGRYICQATELIRATSPLPRYDLLAYWRDIHTRTQPLSDVVRRITHSVHLRLQALATGQSHKVLEGIATRTPCESLSLQAGDWVRVKPETAIVRTLGREGKNRGLAFTVEMKAFCGRTFRVLRRVERIVDDRTGRLIPLSNTVILDGVTCDGCSHLWGGCPRENFHFWREVWLERAHDPLLSPAWSNESLPQ